MFDEERDEDDMRFEQDVIDKYGSSPNSWIKGNCFCRENYICSICKEKY